MVGRPGAYQFSCNAGELAPEVLGNTGLKQYYAGLKTARNVQPVPQGGFDLLPRSRWRASVAADAARLMPFTVGDGAVYMLVVSPGTIKIFKSGALVATISNPWSAGQLPYLKFVQRVETMLDFHPDVPTQKILRHGNDVTWTIADSTYDNIPQVDLGGLYSPVAEVWQFFMNFTAPPTGHGFTITVNGDATTAVFLGTGLTNFADLAVAMKSAIEALPEVDPGISVVLNAATSTAASYTITFTGGRNAGAKFVVSGNWVTGATASINTWRATIGVPGGEDLFSVARGYAAAGTFYQDRLWQGGFKAKTSAFLASRPGEYFDLNINLSNAAGAILDNLDTKGAEKIIEIIEANHLVIFTNKKDYFISNRTIDRTQPLNSVKSSEYGCSPRVPVVADPEGALYYINEAETLLLAANYNSVNDRYVSDPVSLLSSHLVASPRDAALQKGSTATDSNRYWMVRDDGLVVCGLLIRNQDVAGFVRWQTDGLVRAVAVDGANVVHLLVDRIVNGVTQRSYETLEDGLLLDGAISFTFGTPASHITGLTMHAGASVWAIADGYIEGPYIVSSGGTIDLRQAATDVTIGRWTAPLAEGVPPVRDVAPHTVVQRPGRIYAVWLHVIDTDSIAIGANGYAAKDVPLYRAGQPTDQPLLPYSGRVEQNGLSGFADDPTWVITQVRPGRLAVRDINAQAKL